MKQTIAFQMKLFQGQFTHNTDPQFIQAKLARINNTPSKPLQSDECYSFKWKKLVNNSFYQRHQEHNCFFEFLPGDEKTYR
jgi:hypothetical protein